MPPLRLGLAVATSTALLWAIGALVPSHPLSWTSLDLRWYFFPLYEWFYGALRAGAPTIWNPYQLCGMPVLGTLQGGFFYPFHVLYLLLPTTAALAASTVLHVALTAGTGAAFARRAGLSAPAAILSTAVFTAAGPMRHWQLWPYLLEACAWLPLGAIGILDLGENRRARGTLILALATGMSFLAGGPQGTVFAAYTWAALLLARLVSRGWMPGEHLRTAAAAAAALVLGGLLGAVALLPAYEMAQESIRRTSTLSIGLMYPVGGMPTIPDLVQMVFGGGSAVVKPALLLAPFALLARGGWLTAWALVVGGLAVLLSLGPLTPAFHLYLVLPVLAWFRVPYRALLIANFCLGILAGLGLDALTRLFRVRAAGALLVTAIIAGLVLYGLRAPRPAPPLPYYADAIPWTTAQHDAYARLARMAGSDRVWPFDPSLGRDSLPPKLSTLTGVRSIVDYEPLALQRQSEFFVYFLEGSTVYSLLNETFGGRFTSMRPPRGREPLAARRRLLDLAATRFLVVLPQALRRPDVAVFVRDAGLEARPPLGPGLELLENPHALPRAYVTYRARRAPAARELLPLLAQEGFDPLVESWIEADADLEPAPDAPARGAAATIVRDDPHVVEVHATLAAPGLVVLADTFARGWRATVDGHAAPILATNHLFRGVPTPAGAHVVRFEYRPRGVRIGAALTLASALGLALLAWRVKNDPAS
jgi:hypothetical protein